MEGNSSKDLVTLLNTTKIKLGRCTLIHLLLIEDRDDAGLVDADVEPRRLGHVEVGAGRVAPPAVIAGEVVVWRAEVGGGDGDGLAGIAHVGLARVAEDEVALPA